MAPLSRPQKGPRKPVTTPRRKKLLRQAARLQEASLGPRHPDLANTLNNLGIVCEIT